VIHQSKGIEKSKKIAFIDFNNFNWLGRKRGKKVKVKIKKIRAVGAGGDGLFIPIPRLLAKTVQKVFQKQDFEGLSKIKMSVPLFVGFYKPLFVLSVLVPMGVLRSSRYNTFVLQLLEKPATLA